MCGVLSVLSKNYSQESMTKMVQNMLVPMKESRGPDGSGVHSITSPNGLLTFGHARLAIIDLESRSDQPFIDVKSGIVLSYNGEIYNYLELRQKLKSHHTFLTSSDTEVLLAALKIWGLEKTLPLLKGMFAFVAYNPKSNEIWAARDRAGEKPLSYGFVGNDFIVCSDLRVLHKHPNWQKKVNLESAHQYLHYRFVPAPFNFHDNFKKLPPGCYFRGELSQTREIKPRRYWSLWKEYQSQTKNHSINSRDLEKTLVNSIQKIARASDVEVGVFLSGGIDSSLVASYLQKQSIGKKIKAFTLKFEHPEYDEAPWSKRVADQIGLDHYIVPYGKSDFFNSMETSLKFLDEPVAVHSYFPLSYLAKFAKQHVKVCLSGDGGDELFAGYNRHIFWHTYLEKLFKFPNFLRKSCGALASLKIIQCGIQRLLEIRGVPQPDEKKNKLLSALKASSLLEFYTLLLRNSTLSDQTSPSMTSLVNFQKIPNRTSLEHLMAMDFDFYLPGDVLNKVDRATMSCGLEARSPLLDLDFIQLSTQVPPNLKINSGTGKKILHDLVQTTIPELDWNRPKSGFSTPLKYWMKEIINQDQLDLIQCVGIDTILPSGYLSQNFNEKTPTESDFTVYLLARWLQQNKMKIS